MRQLQMQEQQRQQEEWMRQQQYMQQQQQQQQQQSLFAQPTGYGSNNPFALQTQQQQPQQPAYEPQPSSSFLPVPTVTPQQPAAPPPQPVQPQPTAKPFQAPKKDDGQHAQLAGFLSRGREDGLDTFGNSGNLRKCAVSSNVRRLTMQVSPSEMLSTVPTEWLCSRPDSAPTTRSVSSSNSSLSSQSRTISLSSPSKSIVIRPRFVSWRLLDA